LEYSNQESTLKFDEIKEKLEKELNSESNKNQILNQELQALEQEMKLLKDEEEKINNSITHDKQIVLRDYEGKFEIMNSQVFFLSKKLNSSSQLNLIHKDYY